MATIQELRDQRAAAWAQAQEFNARYAAGATMSAEDEAGWSRALADVDRIGEQIENRERTTTLEASFASIDDRARAEGAGAGAPQPAASTDDRYRSTFMKYLAYGAQALDHDEAALMQANFGQLQNAQGVGTGSAGGYTVPEGFWQKVTETQKFFGGGSAGAEEIPTTTGANLPWPTNDDTSNEGYIVGENTTLTNEGDLTFGQKTLGAYIFASGPIKASIPFLQDNAIAAENFIARKMGERLGRRQNRGWTTGSGSSEPQGYTVGLSTGKTTASATAITVDEIIDLEHSVDAAYRATGRCRFKLNDLVLAYVRKLKDSNGQYLWQPSVQAGTPNLLHGFAYDVNNDMDSAVTASKITMAFGDFQAAYAIRRVTGGQMMRLSERYADALQVGFIGFERADGLVQDASAAKLLVQHS